MRTWLLYFFIFFSVSYSKSQTNCKKIPFYPASHIRNASLEQLAGSCYTTIYGAPNDSAHPAMSSIIPYWQIPVKNYLGIQYFGVCNNFIFSYRPEDFGPNSTGFPVYRPLVPQPIPDGKGVLGFLSQRSSGGTASSDTFLSKEYISNNLLRPLKKDSTYRLSFYIGLGLKDTIGIPYNGRIYRTISSSPTKFTLFGLADSSHLPFPKPKGNHGSFGCLSQINSEWVCLGTAIVSGMPGTWVKASIEFTAVADFQSIAIGPACDFSDVPYTFPKDDEYGFYYFLDNLQFFQASAPKPVLEVSGGSFCDGPNASLTLHMKSATYYTGSQLQWFKNNSAIPETGGKVTITKNLYGEGWYQCGVQNDSVCIRSDSFHVFWDPVIGGFIGNNPDTTACKGDTVLLAINSGTIASYLWSTGSVSSSIHVTQNGTYSVKAANACNTLTAVKNVQFTECPPMIFVPSAFTPNHDGLNDMFRAFYKGKVKTFSLSVYNRYGQRIFFSQEISKGWDGTFHHNMQNPGTYVWVVECKDGNDITHTEKGTVVLLR